jgi:prepilin-type N-terminal cleavage/methylation domain-containing protein
MPHRMTVAEIFGLPGPRRPRRSALARGFTLLEILMAMTIMGVLATAGFASYERSLYKARVAQAVTDMLDIATRIKEFELNNRRLPDSLGEIGRAGKLDPGAVRTSTSIWKPSKAMARRASARTCRR